MTPSLLLAMSMTAASAANLSGTVSDLSGNPLRGAVVQAASASDISHEDGSWALGRILEARPTPVERHLSRATLVQENGRLQVRWDRRAADGRLSSPIAAVPAARGTALRSTGEFAAPETLDVIWRGKRLVHLVVPSGDSVGILFRIDTAWDDDHGIPWNPRIAYGSLRDARDGHVYRTVTVGHRTWMAQNLAANTQDADSGVCYHASPDSCAKYGRLYTWAMAMAIDHRYDTLDWNSTDSLRQGLCPAGWRLPTKSEIEAFADSLGDTSAIAPDTLGRKLKSMSGWIPDPAADVSSIHPNGVDLHGMRILPGGLHTEARVLDSTTDESILSGLEGFHWTSSSATPTSSWNWYFSFGDDQMLQYPIRKTWAASIRCIQN